MSKFAVHGGRGNLDDPSSMDVDENDPRAMARMMRQMGEESGEPMEPEMEEMINRMEAALETRERVIDRFDIRPEDYGTVVRLFEGGSVDPLPAAWVDAGTPTARA